VNNRVASDVALEVARALDGVIAKIEFHPCNESGLITGNRSISDVGYFRTPESASARGPSGSIGLVRQIPRVNAEVCGRLCSVGIDLKKFAAANYFRDLQTEGILLRSDLLTVTNFAHYDDAIPFYFY